MSLTFITTRQTQEFLPDHRYRKHHLVSHSNPTSLCTACLSDYICYLDKSARIPISSPCMPLYDYSRTESDLRTWNSSPACLPNSIVWTPKLIHGIYISLNIGLRSMSPCSSDWVLSLLLLLLAAPPEPYPRYESETPQLRCLMHRAFHLVRSNLDTMKKYVLIELRECRAWKMTIRRWHCWATRSPWSDHVARVIAQFYFVSWAFVLLFWLYRLPIYSGCCFSYA